MKRFNTLLITSLFTLMLLQGCGFHLRGAVQLPSEMAQTWVAGSVSSELQEAVSDAIAGSNVALASTASAATATLTLSNEQFDRRVATVGSSGKVNEYELNYRVHWTLTNKSGAVLREGTVQQRENYRYDSAQVLGKSEEERYLRGVMVKAATRDLVRMLRSR